MNQIKRKNKGQSQISLWNNHSMTDRSTRIIEERRLSPTERLVHLTMRQKLLLMIRLVKASRIGDAPFPHKFIMMGYVDVQRAGRYALGIQGRAGLGVRDNGRVVLDDEGVLKEFKAGSWVLVGLQLLKGDKDGQQKRICDVGVVLCRKLRKVNVLGPSFGAMAGYHNG